MRRTSNPLSPSLAATWCKQAGRLSGTPVVSPPRCFPPHLVATSHSFFRTTSKMAKSSGLSQSRLSLARVWSSSSSVRIGVHEGSRGSGVPIVSHPPAQGQARGHHRARPRLYGPSATEPAQQPRWQYGPVWVQGRCRQVLREGRGGARARRQAQGAAKDPQVYQALQARVLKGQERQPPAEAEDRNLRMRPRDRRRCRGGPARSRPAAPRRG
jgi:hypothetical protein